MIISSVLFDVILFGGLLVAVVLEGIFPHLVGATTLVALAAALYVAAGELSQRLARRALWTQEALATGLSLSVLFFVYWWWRNFSDLSLLALSIVLMMTALMLTIAIISCANALWTEKSAKPLLGFLLTAGGGVILGGLAAPLVLSFATTFKLGAVIIGGIIWKARERFSSMPQDAEIDTAELLAERWVLLPQGGRLLDRLVPVLVIGILSLFAARELGQSATLPGTPSIAAPAER